jgi:acetolactate synthase-1/3 small subunit
LNKLVDVFKVAVLSRTLHIERELMLIRIRASNKEYEEINRLINISHGRIIDVNDTTYVVELVGYEEEIDSFLAALDPALILETVRSGICAILRSAPD